MKSKKSQSGSDNSADKIDRPGKAKNSSRNGMLTPPWSLIAAFIVVYLGVGAILYFKSQAKDEPPPKLLSQGKDAAPAPRGDDMQRALSLDSQSYGLFVSGQYERSLAMLEDSIKVYEQKLKLAIASGDEPATRQLETLVAENHQHIGKCYLMLGKQAQDQTKSEDHFQNAVSHYRLALPFYQKYGNYRGSTMPEMLQDYSELLSKLQLADELDKVKKLARRNNITLKG